MNAIELVKTASAEGTRFEMKVIVELDNENKIQWNGGNRINKSAAYCVKKNDNGMALFMMAINPVQEWHFVGKISE
jgi:hypothetical protein